MQISDNYKQNIIDEFRYVSKRMGQTVSDSSKIYYYSAAYAIVFRILNLEYNSKLVFLHHILQTSYEILNTQQSRINTGQERVIQIPEIVFTRMGEALFDLANKIERDEDINETLEKIVIASYIATGNGFYLYGKGILKI